MIRLRQFCWFAAFYWLCVPSALAAELSGRVVSVADGDSLTIQTADRQRHRIRLDGIDAPERTQPYSQVSRRNLQALTTGKQVTVTSSKTDRFGRIVGIVATDQHPNLGIEQIEAGLAWHFRRYEGEQTSEKRAAYAAQEVIARAAQRGLWRDVAPVRPWVFRVSKGINEPVKP